MSRQRFIITGFVDYYRSKHFFSIGGTTCVSKITCQDCIMFFATCLWLCILSAVIHIFNERKFPRVYFIVLVYAAGATCVDAVPLFHDTKNYGTGFLVPFIQSRTSLRLGTDDWTGHSACHLFTDSTLTEFAKQQEHAPHCPSVQCVLHILSFLLSCCSARIGKERTLIFTGVWNSLLLQHPNFSSVKFGSRGEDCFPLMRFKPICWCSPIHQFARVANQFPWMLNYFRRL